MSPKTTGATRKGDKIFCDYCNSDLTVKDSVTVAGHADSKDFYSWKYRCNKCGAHITQTYERDEASKKLWSDEEDGEQ